MPSQIRARVYRARPPLARLCAGFIVAKQLALAEGGASGGLLDRSQSHVPINAFGRVSVITVEVPIDGARQGTFERSGRDVEGHSLQGQPTLDHELLHGSSLY